MIEKAQSSIKPGCYKVPVPCEEHVTEKMCEERVQYSPLKCSKTLVVTPGGLKQKTVRRMLGKGVWSLDLTNCGGILGNYCKEQDIFHLSAKCARLEVSVLLQGRSLPIANYPTCENPTLVLDRRYLLKTRNIPNLFWTDITITEHAHEEDSNVESDCSKLSSNFCVLEKSNPCIDANQTKIIQGISIQRACWGEEREYRCAQASESNCAPLIANQCTNTASTCVSKTLDHCDILSKTFQCVQKTCFPDKEICPEALPCVGGECDESETFESDDMSEGVGRLGALGGVAEEVAVNKVTSKEANIFKGDYQECESYPLGLRNCCTDKGFLDGLIHCPSDMQPLMRAKLEGRAFALGHYKHHVFGTTRYGYCVFPTKLSGVVQIQGRNQQLHISFGDAENPVCRGITPEELERIDFKALDLKDMVQEILDKKVLPEEKTIDAANANHVTSLYNQGETHD
ncbi:MAG: conjugal transfer protein TraN [Legionellales bacterium]|nr:conjugal transfer protein TraN [Legionellales bacterium]